MQAFTIGHDGRTTGSDVQTIRYDERIGRLPQPDSSEGDQRLCIRADIDRLGLIRHARDLGLSIEAIHGARRS